MGVHASRIEEVYRRRHRVFRNALACVTGSYESADDVVQEAFARALARQNQFRSDGPIEAWIWRIAMRTALETRSAVPELPITVDPQIVEPHRDPELAAALRTLPPRRRLIVFLRYVGDLSYVEIAHVCGISEGTVAATLAQARAALGEELGYAHETRRSEDRGSLRR